MAVAGLFAAAMLLAIQPGTGTPPTLPDLTLAGALEICPALLAGRLSQNPADLASYGFRRQPQIEAQLPRTSQAVRPFVAVAGTTEAGVFIAFWADRGFCTVSFKGAEAGAALSALAERMRGDPVAFVRQPGSGDGDWEAPLSFRSEAGLIVLRRPPPGDDSQSYTVTFQARTEGVEGKASLPSPSSSTPGTPRFFWTPSRP